MAGKTAHDAAKAKAAKQKKILAVLSVPLAIALFFAYHTVSKLNSSDAPAPAPSSVAAPGTAVPAAGTPVAATVPATTVPSATPSLPAGAGKLTGLGLLAAKDPFHAQGPKVASATSQQDTQKSKRGKAAKHKAAPPTAAVIGVNGQLASIPVGAAFPATKDPATNGVFRLVSLTRTTAKIAVVGGSYASGAHTLTLTVNSVVTLVNTADGKKYTLVLYPPGTPAPALAGAPTTTTTAHP